MNEVSASNLLPGAGGIAGDIVAVVLALIVFALLFLSIRWIDKI